MNNNGNLATADLQKMLAESEKKLRDALDKIRQLEDTMR